MKMNIVINADDFGWNESCSKAILEAFEKDFITTSTAVANGAYFEEAVRKIKGTPYEKQIGIHLNLTEGVPLTKDIQKDPFFCDETGMFHMGFPRYQKLNAARRRMVYEELTAQVEKYLKTGLSCHHVDSHHHIHTAPYITPIVLKVMQEHDLKGLRLHRNIGAISHWKLAIKNLYNRMLKRKGLAYSDYFGSFDDLESCPELGDKTLEIMCHPDFTKAGVLIDRSGAAEYDDPYGKAISDCVKKLYKKD